MIPSFVKRLSSRLFKKSAETDSDETDARPTLSRQSTQDKTPLSKRPTIQLEKEESVSRRSSRKVTLSNSVSRKSADGTDKTSMVSSRSLSKKLSSAGKNTSLTSKPILAGRAPSLTAHASKASVTKELSAPRSMAKKNDPTAKTLWYLRGTYVTVRNDDGGWFLCRIENNVYNTTKSVKIRWLSKKTKGGHSVNENDYELDYRDEIDPACILFNVRVTKYKSTYTLYDEDRLETDKLCKVAADVASGKLASDDVDSDVEEVVQIEPPAKKRKTEGRKKGEGKKKEKKDKISKESKVKKSSGEKKKKEKKDKPKKDGKEPKRKVAKKKKVDLELHPNTDIVLQEKDPFFETNQSVPFVSKYSHSRLVFRAVHMKNHKLLKKLFKDTEKVRLLSHWRSVTDRTTALHHAITLKDKEAIKLLSEDFNSSNTERMNTLADKVNVEKLGTGTYNVQSLGVAYIRPLMASRGSREGNNALTKDLEDMQQEPREELDFASYIEHAMKTGLDHAILKDFLSCGDEEEDMYDYSHYSEGMRMVDLALERGHIKLAGEYMKDLYSVKMRRMSSLHFEVLLSEKELRSVPPSQVKRGIKQVNMITPIHCAACNSDPQYLKKLLEVELDVSVADKQNRRPIHFAAGCEGTGPLELLLSDAYAANMFATDRNRNTPLHFAVRANRLKNVQVLLKAGAVAEIASDDPHEGKFGVGAINQPNKKSFTPLHMAAENGNLEIVKELFENGANVNATLKTSLFKLTPLMVASQYGYYNVVMYLVESGAIVHQRDRLNRTAVIHAAMNGNTNVLSYLLHIGASPNLCDNSGNSPLHYAAAYGWYFCVKTLLEAGADVNVGNDWKTTPLSIAYLKGHIGCVRLLLTSDVDVNFADDEGLTLISIAASSDLYPDLVEQIRYLINDKGALCTVKDAEDATPLHHLARNSILLEGTRRLPTPSVEAMETSVKIAQLLIEHGCDHKAVDKKGMTAAMEAMRSGNIELFKYLVEAGCPVVTDLDKDGTNILHYLCYDHMNSTKDYLAILKYVADMDGKSGTQNLKKDFCDMAVDYSHLGTTALLVACQQYKSCPKGWDLNTEEDIAAVKELWKRGRDLIKFLIDVFDSDINAMVEEKHYETDEEKPELEINRYQPVVGKWSVAHMLAMVDRCEYGGHRGENEPTWPALRMILQYTPNLNTRDLQGQTPLSMALETKTEGAVRLLVTESNADVNDYRLVENYKDGKKYKTYPVIIAAQSRMPSLVEAIVKAEANPNVMTELEGMTPLHAAINFGDRGDATVEMIETLVEHGADVNVLNREKRSLLHFAVSYNRGGMDENFDLILALLEAGIDLGTTDIDHRTALHYVFAEIGSHRIHMSWNQYEPVHDPVELCRIIASRMNSKQLNIQDKFGMTALHRAAFRGANICCMYLIQKGVDVNIKDNDGNTVLSMALKALKDGCAAILIQNGASLKDLVFDPDNTFSRTDMGDKEEELLPVWKWKPKRQDEETTTAEKITVFEFAIRKDLQGVCFLVMEKPVKESGITFGDAIEVGLRLRKYNIVLRLLATTADVSSLLQHRKHGRNLLHILSLTATEKDDLIEKVVTEFVERGVSLTKQDDYKCTPLIYASLNHNFELCGFYMKTPKVYNPKYVDSFNRSVLSAAFWKTDNDQIDVDHTWWVHELHKKKASLNELIDRPLQECLFGSSTSTNPDYWKAYDTAKVSPLIIAINHGAMFFTQWFLKKGANVNFPDSHGRTPMMHAVRLNDLHFVKTLMNFNFDPNVTEEDIEKESKKKQKVKAKARIFKLKRNASILSSSEDEEEEEEDEEEKDNPEKEEETEKSFKPYKKRSNVNLNAVDKNGWTVMHHAVCPLSFGTFDNDEMVFILAKAGAKLNVKNKKGETPLDLALDKGAPRIARMIQELEGVREKNRREPEFTTVRVSDNLTWPNPRPSFHEDAERFLDKVGRPMEVEEEHVAKIDITCNVTNGTLVRDEDQDRLYDVLLTKVDVNYGVWGLYNFYKMQLVHQKGKNLFILFTRWGRIGVAGQFQHTPFQDKDAGVKEFCKIFREKTGNNWTEIKSFAKKPMKYRLVPDSVRRKGPKPSEIQFENKSTVKSKLPKHLQDLMKKMTNIEVLKKAVTNEAVMMPFGRIQRDRLLKARSLLEKIRVIVTDVEAYRNLPTEQAEKLKEKYEENCEEIGVLSSEYFTVIPQGNYAYEQIRPLDQLNSWQGQMNIISNLLDYEVASRMLLGAKYREKDMNPLDYVYQSLGCQIELMAEEDVESQYILKYISSSCAVQTQVEAIYRVDVEGEQADMDKTTISNHRLLWKKMDNAKCLGILHRGAGVKNSQEELIFHEQFVDVQDHWYRNQDCKTLFAILCEVALGKSEVRTDSTSGKPKPGKDSVMSMGRIMPKECYNVQLPTGCVISLGEDGDGDSYYKDEYICNYRTDYRVYDASQACVRYLIQYRV